MKVSKVPTLRVKNTRNLKHEGKWDPFLSAVVCTWRRKGFPPTYPTFPSKAFQAGGTVDRIQLIPPPSYGECIHYTKLGFPTTVKKKGFDRFISAPFLLLLRPQVLLVSCQLRGRSACRVLESYLGASQMEADVIFLLTCWVSLLTFLALTSISELVKTNIIKLNDYRSSVFSASYLVGLGFYSQPEIRQTLSDTFRDFLYSVQWN